MEKEKKVTRRRRQQEAAQEWGGKADSVITQIHKRKVTDVNAEAEQEVQKEVSEVKAKEGEEHKVYSVLPVSPQSKRNVAIEISNAVVRNTLKMLGFLLSGITKGMRQQDFYAKVRVLEKWECINITFNDIDVIALRTHKTTSVGHMFFDVSPITTLKRMYKTLENTVYDVYYKSSYAGTITQPLIGDALYVIDSPDTLLPAGEIQAIQEYLKVVLVVKTADEGAQAVEDTRTYGANPAPKTMLTGEVLPCVSDAHSVGADA